MKTKINCLCCVLIVLQVTVLSPPARKRKRGGSRSRRPLPGIFCGSPPATVARGRTRRTVLAPRNPAEHCPDYVIVILL
ncbi:hypothetical protein Peur_051980 [Populus x canadensis]